MNRNSNHRYIFFLKFFPKIIKEKTLFGTFSHERKKRVKKMKSGVIFSGFMT